MSNNVCRVCTNTIMQMCRKGTGLCGENCQKVEETSQQIETHTPEEIREAHGLSVIEVVQPSPDIDPEIKRPSVPCLLGAQAAEELEKAGELLEGDVRRRPYGKFERWDGAEWHPVEKPERKAS